MPEIEKTESFKPDEVEVEHFEDRIKNAQDEEELELIFESLEGHGEELRGFLFDQYDALFKSTGNFEAAKKRLISELKLVRQAVRGELEEYTKMYGPNFLKSISLGREKLPGRTYPTPFYYEEAKKMLMQQNKKDE